MKRNDWKQKKVEGKEAYKLGQNRLSQQTRVHEEVI